MRLVLIHGINNENNSPNDIIEIWWAALSKAWTELGLAVKPRPPIDVGYYADLLSAAATGRRTDARAMGDATQQSSGAAIEFLKEYARAAGVTQQELNDAADAAGVPREAVEQGVPHEGWIIAFAAALERVLPTKGKYVARLFLPQAAIYVEDAALAERIDMTVKAQACDNKLDPAIVIAHSLGTVVAFRIFGNRQQAGRNVPLFLTLGSPLSMAMFKPILPPRGSLPKPPLGKWVNGRHRDDFITLGRAITKDSIGFDGVMDETRIVNDVDDKHSIRHYLASPVIAKLVYDAI